MCETVFATDKRSWGDGDKRSYTDAEHGSGRRMALLAGGPAVRHVRPSTRWVPTTEPPGFSCCAAALFACIFCFCWLLIQGERNLDWLRAETKHCIFRRNDWTEEFSCREALSEQRSSDLHPKMIILSITKNHSGITRCLFHYGRFLKFSWNSFLTFPVILLRANRQGLPGRQLDWRK